MKILCLPYTHTLSHVSRLLAVAEQLRENGHGILFAGRCDGAKDRLIEEKGFELLPLYQIDQKTLFGRIQAGKIKFVSDTELALMIEADRELFRNVRPDLVLSDGRFSAPISTGIENIKHAAIVNVSSTEFRALPYVPFFDWIPFSFLQKHPGAKKCLDNLNLHLEMFLFDAIARNFKVWSKKNSLQKTVTATNCLTGKDLTLLADIPEYFPTRNLPNDYRYIGPLTWKFSGPMPSWWPPPQKSGSTIYITMGTTWVGGNFNTIIDLVRKYGLAAVITTGGQGAADGGKKADLRSGEIYVTDFLDGDSVLKHVDLIICHGGNGTIYQALQQGKPIIGIPTIPDQEFNMRRVEALGVGQKLSRKELESNPESLFKKIQHILREPSYRERAAVLREKLRAWDAPSLATRHIENLIKQ